MAAKTSTVDNEEMEYFGNLVSKWWDERGPMEALHHMNKLRIPFIIDTLINTGLIDQEKGKSPIPLKGISLLDVGCGGGILAEPLARFGGDISAIDANVDLIQQARDHAKLSNLKINYVASSIEEYALNNTEMYDVVIASEILEHVSNKEPFVQACVRCLKPGGSIFVTTINKTILSNFLAIIVYENIFNWIGKGTHQYEKFIEPVKLQQMLEDCNCKTQCIHGWVYNGLTGTWYWCRSSSAFYALHAVKLIDK